MAQFFESPFHTDSHPLFHSDPPFHTDTWQSLFRLWESRGICLNIILNQMELGKSGIWKLESTQVSKIKFWRCPKQWALVIGKKTWKPTWWNLSKIFEILKHFGWSWNLNNFQWLWHVFEKYWIQLLMFFDMFWWMLGS